MNGKRLSSFFSRSSKAFATMVSKDQKSMGRQAPQIVDKKRDLCYLGPVKGRMQFLNRLCVRRPFVVSGTVSLYLSYLFYICAVVRILI